MQASFSLSEKSHHARFLGTRHRARELRVELEYLLQQSGEVTIDFTDFEATQSFLDELIGQLVLRDGDDLLSRLVFKGCSEELKAIIQFVVADRAAQYHQINQGPRQAGQ